MLIRSLVTLAFLGKSCNEILGLSRTPDGGLNVSFPNLARCKSRIVTVGSGSGTVG